MRASRVLVGMAATMAIAACGADAGEGVDAPAAGDRLPVVAAPEVLDPAGIQAVAPEVVAPEAAPQPAVARAVDVETPVAPELQAAQQPAVWPAPDVVFATPEEAADDFVRSLLISEGDPALGPFQQGDSRSGEIEVLFAGEDGMLDPPQVKGMLSLRQIGPSDGWFVIGAGSDGASISSPETLAEVPAGPLTVEGEARGFESTVVVRAFPQGDDSSPFDQVITSGGAFGDVEPYSATVDLSGASPGDVVALLVQGDTGLGTDPSTFAAIPVVVADGSATTIPPTR